MRKILKTLILCACLSLVSITPTYSETSDNLNIKELKEKAINGNPQSQFDLGMRYLQKKGLPRDIKKGIEWILKAGEQGHSRAQVNLGAFYADGVIISQNYEESFKWYELAAKQGEVYGQVYLGELYEGGNGVDQNFIEAYAWTKVAAFTVDPSDAEFSQYINDRLSILSKNLTKEDQKKAAALTEEYLKIYIKKGG